MDSQGMDSNGMDRRHFSKLAASAIGGLLAGATVGMAQETALAKKDPKSSFLLQEPHICRGLNPTCKGEIKGKKHDCAGQAHYASVEITEHVCKGHNDCAGEGGCGEKPGENTCKGKGECAIPLSDETWKKARKNFEAAMTKAGKKFGPAPAKS